MASLIEAYIFDLDGVITDTRREHFRAWKKLFDAFLADQRVTANAKVDLSPFSMEDYENSLDGRRRDEGILHFLNCRGISSQSEVIDDLGKKKNDFYHQLISREGVKLVRDSLIFVHNLKKMKIPTALVSSSQNAEFLLTLAKISDLFDVLVTPQEGKKLGLMAKPFPDYFLQAAKLLQMPISKCAVVEDSRVGVEAGRNAGSDLVVGILQGKSKKREEQFIQSGAHRCVLSLLEMEISSSFYPLPHLLTQFEEIFSNQKKKFLLFLDFDGTLSEIQNSPQEAFPLAGVVELIKELNQFLEICIITGRDLEVIKKKIPLGKISFCASHGFDFSIKGENLNIELFPRLEEHFSKAELYFKNKFSLVKGFVLEKKKFALALHYRMIREEETVSTLIEEVRGYIEEHEMFKIHQGEMVIELLPNFSWDKGKAILKTFELLHLDKTDYFPIYIGDGKTDEDAFREMRNWGIPILASKDPRPSLARYALSGPQEVRTFLEKFLTFLRTSL